jgi:hypothetical protein
MPSRFQKIELATASRSEFNKTVPEIFRHHGHRFFFFSREAEEPIHVHVESAEKDAKFWLNSIFAGGVTRISQQAAQGDSRTDREARTTNKK